MCEHAKTDNVKVISDILLQQVENLSKTDRTYQTNLEIAGGSLEKIRFVRGANYLHQMSDIVQRQEKEIAVQQAKIDKSDSLLDENQMLKEKVQELQIEVTRLRQSEKYSESVQMVEMLRDKVRETDRHLRLTLDRLTEEHMKC